MATATPSAPSSSSAALLALADVILSVDQVQQYMDSDKYRWHIDSELNTGVIFFRNSPGGVAVLDECCDRGLSRVGDHVVECCGDHAVPPTDSTALTMLW